MGIAAGRLRHRVRIEVLSDTEDAAGGTVSTWTTWADRVPAAVEPLSAREFFAASQVHSEVTAKIVMRHRAGLHPAMRIVHGSQIYNIAGILPDADSGIEYVTIPVSRGVNAG